MEMEMPQVTMKEAFNVGAGLTLGNAAVNLGMRAGDAIVANAQEKGYYEYRTTVFDPVVRQDISQLWVLNRLSEMPYPFEAVKEKDDRPFLQRYLLVIVLIALMLVGQIIHNFVPALQGLGGEITIASSVVLSIIIVVFLVKKTGKAGSNTVKKQLSKAYKPELDELGRRYWLVREHVRQAVALGELTPFEGVKKLMRTDLVSLLPDSFDELDAHIFNYRQQVLNSN
ncbi:hypothetical protein BSR28_06375 [Boudabousia liubingyangii]|uniref:hypothetical protein n=1 Tax=Boudabousia liubingyangii TaxID=1921764 RepID=UPI00093D1883|nr:hypothetical protein [Boudabousia liubingyangii]OKL47036.1 hypothetical protein BSR28_06375 [Boudabousia liubingyangii]